MLDRIRIRARVSQQVTEVQILLLHPMETGLRRDADGAPVAAHHITEVQVTASGRPVFSARLSIAVSQDPLLSFRFRGAQAGDPITVVWTDNQGAQGIKESRVD